MKIRSVRLAELVLIIVLFWAVCWLFVWWIRTPSVCSGSSSIGMPVAGQSRVGDFYVKQDSAAQTKIPVYIVEEHHEVIKYWYGAANQGYIPKSGNVLLHIDGHSDGATPPKWMLGPLFRYPISNHELTNMMQENDVFIVASALTGFIDRFIWVWPTWNTDSSEGQSEKEYASFPVRYGSMNREDTKTGRLVMELCACMSSKEFNFETYCFMNNASDLEDMDGIPIKESECNIKYSGLVEIVSEIKAISLIKSGIWITAKDKVLLDVDEDFYGVEASVSRLYGVGIDQDRVDEVSQMVKRLVCASNTHQERQTDSFYNYLIQTIIDFKIVCSQSEKVNDSICKNSRKLASAVKKLRPEFMKNLRERNLEQHICDHTRIKLVLNKLILEFCKMTIDQLKAFAEVGICLNQSPKTMNFDHRHSMRVCYGYNTPNETAVMFHVPSLAEIDQRTDNLKDILKQKQFVPGAVTICRSTRDGYTPKKYFTKIESDVKLVLRDAFPRIREDSFYYDEDLLGGPSGWHGRH
ncbi:uncharacterized protein LOC121379021 isoform X2 [Gigantopelta aegis]|nr:uncharacterized protein LOC121379021 isoform X2 [Gigantopelta aegis]